MHVSVILATSFSNQASINGICINVLMFAKLQGHFELPLNEQSTFASHMNLANAVAFLKG